MVFLFLLWSRVDLTKTPSDATLLGRTSSEVFVKLLFFIFVLHFVVVSSFVDVLHFAVVSSFVNNLHFVVLSSFVNVLHFVVALFIFFSMSSLTLLWTIIGVFTPYFIHSAQPISEWFATLSFFDHFVLAASATALSGNFLSIGIFYLTLVYQRFNPRLLRLPWELAFLPWSLQGFILILETQTWPICLFDSQ